MTFTQRQLFEDLIRLGIDVNDILFVHSSFKSIGNVSSGASSIIKALDDSVGPNGLILMPSFNLVDRKVRADLWEINETPSTTGWLTEYFRNLPETWRSDHYSHSVAARGQNAQTFVSEHKNNHGFDSPWDLEPWGKTFGTYSPMFKAYKEDGRILMIGVDYQSSTYIHLVEVIIWHIRRIHGENVPFPMLDRAACGQYWQKTGEINKGFLGNAECQLFSIRDYVDSLVNHYMFTT